MNNKNALYIIPAVILGAALIISSLVGITGYYKAQNLSNVLSVTGSAKQAITSDRVRWIGSFDRRVPESNLKGGYVQMNDDLARVKKFITDKGIDEKSITVSTVMLNEVYRQYDTSPKEYTLNQTIEVNSEDLNTITNLAKDTQGIINQGVIFSTRSLEYTYSKLAELRVSLLKNALEDAKNRATSLAEASGSSVGGLRSASVGVVQVLSQNSVEVSDYGAYDTSNIDKDVMVTVKAAFSVN